MPGEREELLITLCILHGGYLWDASYRVGMRHWVELYVFDQGWNEKSPGAAAGYNFDKSNATWAEACEKYLTRHGVPFDHI